MAFSADDYAEIQMLLSGYCFAVDWGDVDQVSALFHPAGRLAPLFQGEKVYEGAAAIQDWFTKYFDSTRKPRRFVRHKMFPAQIVLKDGSPRSSMYFDSESIPHEGDVVTTVAGRYDSLFARHEGRWLLKEHTILAYYTRQTKGFTVLREQTPPIVIERR